MPRYRYEGEGRVFIPDARVEVESGAEFDSPVELNNPTLTLVESDQPAPPPAPQPPTEEVTQ
jgi:hypothetical protein